MGSELVGLCIFAGCKDINTQLCLSGQDACKQEPEPEQEPCTQPISLTSSDTFLTMDTSAASDRDTRTLTPLLTVQVARMQVVLLLPESQEAWIRERASLAGKDRGQLSACFLES